MRRFVSIALFVSSLMTATNPTALQAQQADDIRATANQALTAFNIPGLAVVAVKDGNIILAEGFGVRDIQSNEPVTATTLFGVASHTKAFTATALALLVEQGKLNWDDKVIQHLPEFRLADPVRTADVTIRDLLSHRTGLGLGAGDLMIWPNTDKTMADILAGIPHLPLANGLREKYAYNNIMYVVAGEIVTRVSGMPYHDFVRQFLLDPMGMNDTVIGFSKVPPTTTNLAIGTIEKDAQLHRFPLDYLEDFAAAGAMLSNANDFAKWLLVQTNQGKTANGTPIFSETSQQQLWHTVTPLVVSESAAANGTQFRAYGLGWAVKNEFGVKQISHSGGILGMLSLTTIIPEHRFAITVMSNQQAFGALTAITQEAIEDLLELPNRDWLAEEQAKYQQAMQKKATFELTRPALIREPLPLASYAGSYRDNWYGAIEITEQQGELRIHFTHTPLLQGRLEHYNGDTFVVYWDEPLLEADAYIDFTVTRDNQVTEARLKAIASFTDFSFDFHHLRLQRQ